MNAKIIHVLCEGQTEQGFVEDVLKPYLIANGCAAVKSVLVTTNKKKNAYGGMVSYSHAYNDLQIMLGSNKDGKYEKHIFTTMFDLYALPNDFPGYDKSHSITDRYDRVSAFERAFSEAIDSDRFIPYIQLHEYEALVFCGLDYLKEMYKDIDKNIETLKAELAAVGNPELVNDSPKTAPSKRIIKAIEGDMKNHYNYDKPKAGKFVAEKVGVAELRTKCRHFNEWIEKLIN
ncbi:MAG: DUF4276 family protein [Paludibacteraceae bacterium]|nr:DUF4276 family protein [Paludibacteraceae bacterium]